MVLAEVGAPARLHLSALSGLGRVLSSSHGDYAPILHFVDDDASVGIPQHRRCGWATEPVRPPEGKGDGALGAALTRGNTGGARTTLGDTRTVAA